MSIDVTETLRQAVSQLRVEKDRIDQQIGTLEALIGDSQPAAKPAEAAPVKRKRKPMSTAAKAEISRRMKASWAKRKKARR